MQRVAVFVLDGQAAVLACLCAGEAGRGSGFRSAAHSEARSALRMDEGSSGPILDSMVFLQYTYLLRRALLFSGMVQAFRSWVALGISNWRTCLAVWG